MASEITFTNFEEHKVETDETLDRIAKQAGITWQQLAQFNWKTSDPRHINEALHDLVGCRHKTKDGKNYIFTSDDDPGIVNVPIKSPHYTLETGKSHQIQVIRPELKTDIEVETVDDLRHVVGNVTVVLKRKEGGPDVEITSDENGYGIAKRVLSGHYEATVKGEGPAFFLKTTNQPGNNDPNADVGVFEDAVIDTRQKVEALTQIVVRSSATPVQKQERHLLQKIYTRIDDQDVKARGTAKKPDGYTRLSQTWAIDNLALVAGWKNKEIDIAGLVSSVLPDFFACYDGTPSHRGYYVWVLQPTAQSPSIGLYNSSGSLEVSFSLVKQLQFLFGAYSTFEESAGQLFVDMMTKSYPIIVVGQENEVVPITDLVSPGDRPKVVDAINSHAGQVAVVYLLPTANLLETIGFHGGSGRLEDYGNQESANKRIHERNKVVCQRISWLYNRYVNGYVSDVRKTNNEKELRALGPPWAPFVMPTPSMPDPVDMHRLLDLYSSYHFDQLKAWSAIAEHLDKFANRLSEGLPFISLKAKYEIEAEKDAVKGLQQGIQKLDGALPVSVEVEGSLTFQFSDDQIRTLAGIEEKGKISAEGKIKQYNVGLEYKRNLKKPEEWEVTIKTGPLELEANKDGTRKISLEALPEVWAESQFNPKEATFEGGMKIETGAILEILEKIPLKNKALKEFLEKHSKMAVPKEVSIHAGFVGLRQRTALALVSNAPGFFDRRELDDLITLKWNGLYLDEQAHLKQLGWDQCSWDLKSYAEAELPETMEKEWDELTAQQQIAILHLGFYDAEDYQKRVKASRSVGGGWHGAIKKRQEACKEGEQDTSADEEE